MRVIEKPTHSTIEWQMIRHRDPDGLVVFGASEAAAVMDRSMYQPQSDLIMRKMAEPQTSEPSPAMETGNTLEPTLVSVASDRLGLDIITPDLMFGKGRFVATPDGIDAATLKRQDRKPEVWLEVKCTSRYAVNSLDSIPETWKWQMAAQQLITEAEMFLIVLDSNLHINLLNVPRNHEAEEALIQQAEILGKIIDSGEFPIDRVGDLTADQIAKIFKAQEKTIELPSDAIEWIGMMEEAKHQKKQYETMEENAKDAIARLLLDATIGTINGQQVISWKEQSGRSSLDQKALIQDHPDLVEKYTKQGNPFRVMRISKKGTKS